jgi:hypothetical protein
VHPAHLLHHHHAHAPDSLLSRPFSSPPGSPVVPSSPPPYPHPPAPAPPRPWKSGGSRLRPAPDRHRTPKVADYTARVHPPLVPAIA